MAVLRSGIVLLLIVPSFAFSRDVAELAPASLSTLSPWTPATLASSHSPDPNTMLPVGGEGFMLGSAAVYRAFREAFA